MKVYKSKKILSLKPLISFLSFICQGDEPGLTFTICLSGFLLINQPGHSGWAAFLE